MLPSSPRTSIVLGGRPSTTSTSATARSRSTSSSGADHDAFTSAIAQQLIRSGQTVSLEDIYPRLEPNRRRYVDKFLSSHRISAHVMVRLETRGAVDGL
jgi:hypothetical protein